MLGEKKCFRVLPKLLVRTEIYFGSVFLTLSFAVFSKRKQIFKAKSISLNISYICYITSHLNNRPILLNCGLRWDLLFTHKRSSKLASLFQWTVPVCSYVHPAVAQTLFVIERPSSRQFALQSVRLKRGAKFKRWHKSKQFLNSHHCPCFSL